MKADHRFSDSLQWDLKTIAHPVFGKSPRAGAALGIEASGGLV
jgi:hypothetical protein